MKYCPVCQRDFGDDKQVCPDDGAVLINKASAQTTLIGTVLKETYRIEEKIGAGGMGAVYRATQIALQRNVAVKVLLPHHQSSSELIQRFFRESRLLSGLSHPNIVSIIDFGNTENGMIYMVMEYLAGQTLADVVRRDVGLPTDTVVGMMEQICMGLGAAHRQHMIHRDLKPSNIFLSRVSGDLVVVKVLDFGIAKLLESDDEDDAETKLTKTGLAMGTPAYIAPEQIAGKARIDERSDIYSLGAIMYYMLCGRPAYSGRSTPLILTRQLTDPPDPIDYDAIGKPDARALDPVIRRALALEPEDRYASAAEMFQDIQDRSGLTGKVNLFIGEGGEGVRASATLTGEDRVRVDPIDSAAATSPYAASTQAALKPLRDARSAGRTSPAGGKGGRGVAIVSAAVAVVGALALIAWATGLVGGDRAPRNPLAAAPPGELIVGMSAAFSGPSKELGRNMKVGIETRFNAINEIGGIHGRTLKLVALDDGYEPERALANMRELIEDRGAFAIVGNVGTPTAEVAAPYAQEKKVVFFGAFTGAEVLRKDPPDRYVFNYRASYAEETAATVHYMVETGGIPPEAIAVFAQEDGYGDSGFRGVQRALRAYGVDSAAILRVGYQRNTSDVERAVEQILARRDEIRGVVMVATYRPAAKFVHLLRQAGFSPLFSNVSFVGGEALAEELRDLDPAHCEGVVVTQVVPHPTSGASLVIGYRDMLERYFPDETPNFVSLEGYIVASLFVEGLKRAGSNPTSDTLVAGLESIRDLDLGIGAKIEFGPSTRQGSMKVWAVELDETCAFRVLELE